MPIRKFSKPTLFSCTSLWDFIQRRSSIEARGRCETSFLYVHKANIIRYLSDPLGAMVVAQLRKQESLSCPGQGFYIEHCAMTNNNLAAGGCGPPAVWGLWGGYLGSQGVKWYVNKGLAEISIRQSESRTLCYHKIEAMQTTCSVEKENKARGKMHHKAPIIPSNYHKSFPEDKQEKITNTGMVTTSLYIWKIWESIKDVSDNTCNRIGMETPDVLWNALAYKEHITISFV